MIHSVYIKTLLPNKSSDLAVWYFPTNDDAARYILAMTNNKSKSLWLLRKECNNNHAVYTRENMMGQIEEFMSPGRELQISNYLQSYWPSSILALNHYGLRLFTSMVNTIKDDFADVLNVKELDRHLSIVAMRNGEVVDRVIIDPFDWLAKAA